MLGEPSHVTNERTTINGILKVLKNAQKVLKKDPEYLFNILVLQFMKKLLRINHQKKLKLNHNSNKIINNNNINNNNKDKIPQINNHKDNHYKEML